MRTKLLRSGLGFFAFAVGISLVNVLVFPYARKNYGYGLIGLWLAYAAALALLTLAGRAVSRMRADKAERAVRILAPAFTLLLFAVHLLMGYLLEYTPSGDNFMLYKSSQMLATDGNFDNYPYFYLYLSRFSNQWGFTLMLTAFYKLILALGVTQTFYPLVLVQAVLYVFSTRATLRIARRLSGAKGELMTLLMLACCLPMYVAAAVLYTDTFSVPFIMVALDLALRIKDAQSRGAQLALSAACGAVVLIGCQIKMTVLIALMAAVIVWLLEMKPGRAMLCTALCAAIVGGGTAAVQHYMKNEVLDPEMVAQHHTPAIHWVMMSIPSGNNPYGGFSGDYAITWGMMEEGATHEEVMASIYSRMKDKIYTLRYPNRLISAALRKDSAFMGDGTYGMTEMLDDGPVRENVVSSFVLEGRSRYRLHMTLCTGIWLAQLTLALLACVRDIRRSDPASGAKAGSLRYMTLYVAFFGAALFLMLWEARGRYLKVVDADDWVEPEAFSNLLDALAHTNDDAVVSGFYWRFDNGSGEESSFPSKAEMKEPFKGVKYGKSYVLDGIADQVYMKMHGITWRTEILRQMPLSIDEHCYYVDAEYILYPIPWVRTVSFLPDFVYQYRIGRVGQSVSPEKMVQNKKNYDRVLESLCAFYQKCRDGEINCSEEKLRYIESGIARVAAGRVKILLSLPADKKVRNQLVWFDKELLEKYPGIYHANRNKAVKALRMSRYRLYGAAVWALKHQKRQF